MLRVHPSASCSSQKLTLRAATRNFSASASRSMQRLVILGSGWGGYEILRGIDKKHWSESLCFRAYPSARFPQPYGLRGGNGA